MKPKAAGGWAPSEKVQCLEVNIVLSGIEACGNGASVIVYRMKKGPRGEVMAVCFDHWDKETDVVIKNVQIWKKGKQHVKDRST